MDLRLYNGELVSKLHLQLLISLCGSFGRVNRDTFLYRYVIFFSSSLAWYSCKFIGIQIWPLI